MVVLNVASKIVIKSEGVMFAVLSPEVIIAWICRLSLESGHR